MNYNQNSSSGNIYQRPTSAGATRSRASAVYQNSSGQPNGSSGGYARNNAGSSNIYGGQTTGLLGTGFPGQRPSSAGHSRPNNSHSHNQSSSSKDNNGNQQNVPILPTPQQGSYQSGSSNRPKSAGSVRRNDSQTRTAAPASSGIPNISKQNNPTQPPQYYFSQQQQQQLQQQQQQRQYLLQQQHLRQQQQQLQQQQLLQQQQQLQQQQLQQQQQQQPPTTQQSAKLSYHYSALAGATAGIAMGSSSATRPSSAGAIPVNRVNAPINAPVSTTSGTSDHWNTSYKLHYGYAGANPSTATNTDSTAPTTVPTSTKTAITPITTTPRTTNTSSTPVTTVTNSDSSNTARSSTNRIRSAIDQSHKYGEDDLDLDGNNGERELLDRDDDDDEMDGKPVHESRSHPEVSTTTPSQSIALDGVSGVDVRNSSLDSLGEENMNIGLSTVPNQFCSVREAFELKKLLILSKNSRGGIVPSSTAVMDMYMVGKVVGVGSYGKVRAAWHRLTGSKVAIKTYDKSKLKDPAHWKRVHSEIKIMEQISHPRIARMYEAVETPKRMHLIMECLDGGNLCSYVKQKRRLSEDESRRIFFQVLQAIDHLHVQGVSHRDVKLENVLFTDAKDVKLIDFGFSTICQPGKRLKVFCGTPSYMAPEIVRRTEYEGKGVDIWSLGILLYALLCGCFPFRAKSYPDLYRKIARGIFAMPDELSMPVRDMLRQLLTVDADQRITAHQALRHPWLQTCFATAPDIDKLRLETPILISDRPTDDIDDEVMDELEKFGLAKEDMNRLVLTKTHSSLATLYYLLLDTLVTKRRKMGGGKRAVSASSSSTLKQKNTAAISLTAQYMQQQALVNQQPQQQTLIQQQQMQQQLLLNKQQGQTGNGQNFVMRPRSASSTRPVQMAGTTNVAQNEEIPKIVQRPLSAFAGRR